MGKDAGDKAKEDTPSSLVRRSLRGLRTPTINKLSKPLVNLLDCLCGGSGYVAVRVGITGRMSSTETVVLAAMCSTIGPDRTDKAELPKWQKRQAERKRPWHPLRA